jgi:hypothetical protein
MNTTKPLPPIEDLKKVFYYEANTGEILRNGNPVGYKQNNGYTQIHWRKRKTLLAHRLAWALYHGADPYPYEIDHINRNRGDNAITNLRLVTHAQQQANRSGCPQRPIKITYPDGRGSVVVESQGAAARLLGCPTTRSIRTALSRAGGCLMRREGRGWASSGITLCYEM